VACRGRLHRPWLRTASFRVGAGGVVRLTIWWFAPVHAHHYVESLIFWSSCSREIKYAMIASCRRHRASQRRHTRAMWGIIEQTPLFHRLEMHQIASSSSNFIVRNNNLIDGLSSRTCLYCSSCLIWYSRHVILGIYFLFFLST
jgi:hypothetical protein